jgi:hypothetical protein
VNAFWSRIAFSLADFNELSPVALIQVLVEVLPFAFTKNGWKLLLRVF